MSDFKKKTAKVEQLTTAKTEESIERALDWKVAKHGAIRENSAFAHSYFSYRAIELVATIVVKARQDANLTQMELAKLAGVSQPQLSRLENPARPLYENTGTDNGSSLPKSGRIEGPTIGLLGRVLAAAGYKITDLVLEDRETKE